MSQRNPLLRADLFCRVIDNLGDIGVMWRLARQLSTEKNWQVRLWVDRLDRLAQIEHAIDPNKPQQTCSAIEVHHWPDRWPNPAPDFTPAPVVIAGFSCELPQAYLEQLANTPCPIWLQLEYLSAQDWINSFHGLNSERSDKLKPVFFFPGFTNAAGGLLREHDLIERRRNWQSNQQAKPWLKTLGVDVADDTRLVSVFTYANAPLSRLVDQLGASNARFHLLVPQGQHFDHHAPSLHQYPNVTAQTIEFLTQTDYDKLLWSCDLNLVRGEDSWVRAIWAGKPMIWQIYPQQDQAHHPKLQAWLELAELPESLGVAMHEWADGKLDAALAPLFGTQGWQQWQTQSLALSARLAQQTDLASRLDQFCRKTQGMNQ